LVLFLEAPKIVIKPPGPKARVYTELEARYVSTGVGVKLFPLVPERAYGCVIIDVDGNKFIDLLAGAAAANIGYSHPALVKSVEEQVRRMQHSMIGYHYNVRAIELAEKLVRITPGSFAKKVIFGLSGSDACDLAMKVARFSTRKPWLLSFIGSYHGHTYGAASISSFKGLMKRGFSPVIPQVAWVPYAYCYRCPFKQEYPGCGVYCVDYVEEYVLNHVVPQDEVAAVFVEPIQGDAGIVVPPKEFLVKLRKLCDRYGFLLVLDEVQSGMGRTGRWFAVEHFNVEPDLLICGKALASGMGVSAVVGRAEVMDIPSGTGLLTPAANPVASSAALATIEVIEREGLMENAVRIGGYFLRRIEELKRKYEVIGDVRGKGLMIGVEVIRDAKTKQPNPELTGMICWRAFELGLILPSYGFNSNVLRITPPLVMSVELAEKACNLIEAAVKDAVEGRVEKASVTWR